MWRANNLFCVLLYIIRCFEFPIGAENFSCFVPILGGGRDFWVLRHNDMVDIPGKLGDLENSGNLKNCQNL